MSREQNDASAKSIANVINFPDAARNFRPARGNLFYATGKLLLKRMLHAIGDPPLQFELWNGLVVSRPEGGAVARVVIRDWGALLKLIANPELNFGELYSAQRIEVRGNLLDCMEAVYRVWPLRGHSKIGSMLAPLDNLWRNALIEARDNIRHHYDIGNDFYKLWLDERMLYTCAYFSSPDMSLEDAQLAKLDHICRKLCLRPGDKVLEAGCGWGALALHMAKHYGAKVTAYNISHEQITFARQRALAEGLDELVEFIEDDYRNVRGTFDAFVSVGMLEHVGTEHYRELGGVIDRSLNDNGRGLIHTIGLNFPRAMDAWTERHIFPGACLPSLAQMMQIFEPFGFSVLDVENLRLHYAKTAEHWLQRYESNINRVEEMFDQKFVRAWRLYLAGAVTTFKVGGMQLFQVSFARPEQNQIPWTRQYLYEPQHPSAAVSDGKL